MYFILFPFACLKSKRFKRMLICLLDIFCTKKVKVVYVQVSQKSTLVFDFVFRLIDA